MSDSTPNLVIFPRTRAHRHIQQGSNLGDDGAIGLANALRGETTLTLIDLNGNLFVLFPPHISSNSFQSASLWRGAHIHTGNDIGNPGAAELATVLRDNTTITSLHIYSE